ncbi:MAG: adenylate/guanylate cyclase domain-containing protein [Burkholderiaceae bacterium]
MTDGNVPSNITGSGPEDEWLLPLQQHKVVMVLDLVESVRLMAQDEAGVVSRWQGFLRHVNADILPAHQGRLVKSLGDGLLAEFDRCDAAVKAGLALQQHFRPGNARLPADRHMHLRIGINATHLYVDSNDVYGHGVNLAARVADLGSAGDIVITPSVKDQLVEDLDATLEDMGESHLKHWPHPVRTWLVRPPPGQWAAPRLPQAQLPETRATIAVIPFDCRAQSHEQLVIGDLIADGVIAQLSRSQHLRVISRLSTASFRGRTQSHEHVHATLDAAYILSGSYVSVGDRVVVMAELSRSADGEVLWAERLANAVADLLADESQLVCALAEACAHHLLQAEVQRALTQAIPRLDSNALLLGGITLMHRSTKRDMERSRELLDAVIDRHKRVATPWAWLAKWQIMQVVQGLTLEPVKAFQQAIDMSNRALDLEPQSSLALAVQGHAICHLGSNIDESQKLLAQATSLNPNDAMAWLYSSVWSHMWGRAEDSVSAAQNALALSPLDPQRYYFEMMLANSYLAIGDLERSIAFCKSSLSRNRYHLPTVRALLFGQYEAGQIDDARKTLDLLLQLQPDLTVSKYLASGSRSKTRQHGARVLAAMGLPDH